MDWQSLPEAAGAGAEVLASAGAAETVVTGWVSVGVEREVGVVLG